MTNRELIEVLEVAREKLIADGCEGCAFADAEEWEMPCAKCKRAMKDYYRCRLE